MRLPTPNCRERVESLRLSQSHELFPFLFLSKFVFDSRRYIIIDIYKKSQTNPLDNHNPYR